jgi:hypothetical protein
MSGMKNELEFANGCLSAITYNGSGQAVANTTLCFKGVPPVVKGGVAIMSQEEYSKLAGNSQSTIGTVEVPVLPPMAVLILIFVCLVLLALVLKPSLTPSFMKLEN